MSEKIWNKLNQWAGLLPIGALFGLVAFVANIEIKDLDLWLHIGVGKFIWHNHVVPAADILSNSIAGNPWINHEWLFQVIVYNIFEHWGAQGLLRMQIAIVCVTMGVLLILAYSKDRQLLITFMLFLVFLVFQQRFTVRPDIFSLFFFAVYIFILALHIDKKWAAVALCCIQILWVNVHGFFFLGPLFVLIGIVSEWIKRHVRLPYEWNETGRLNDEEYRRLKWIFLLVLLACLVNPYFVRGAWYPVGVLFSLKGENRIFFDVIQELQKPVTWATFWDTRTFIYYKLLIVLSFVSFIFNRRNIDISALIFWLVFLIFSLQAVRNAIFFAFAAYLVIMTNVLTIDLKSIVPIRFTEKKFADITMIVAKILFLMFLFQFGADVSARSYFDFEKYEHKSEYGGISQRTYPDKAVDFLIEHDIKGNFFNDFNSGAYLVGRTFPDIKVYIDGRTEVYGGEFFKRYQEIYIEGNGALFEEEIKKHDITGILMNSSRQHIPKPFLQYIYAQKDWAPVYFDYDGMIFLKRVPRHQAIIDEHEIDLAHWEAKELDLIKLGPAQLVPYRHFFRGYTLNSLELYGPALSELKEAVDIMPSYGAAYHLIGQIYLKQKRFEEAFRNLRVAAVMFPQHQQIRLDLAYSYLELQEYGEALVHAEVILRQWPGDLNAHYLLAEIYARDGSYESAVVVLENALTLKPSRPGDFIAIADLLYDAGQWAQAQKVYEMALNINPDDSHVNEMLRMMKSN